jgi:hypothetical protein
VRSHETISLAARKPMPPQHSLHSKHTLAICVLAKSPQQCCHSKRGAKVPSHGPDLVGCQKAHATAALPAQQRRTKSVFLRAAKASSHGTTLFAARKTMPPQCRCHSLDMHIVTCEQQCCIGKHVTKYNTSEHTTSCTGTSDTRRVLQSAPYLTCTAAARPPCSRSLLL